MKEKLKTIVLCLLIVSAVLLTFLTWAYDPAMLSPELRAAVYAVSAFLDGGKSEPPSSETSAVTTVEYREAARPVVACVTTGTGRFGAAYAQSDVTQIYTTFQMALGEAIGSASELTPVSEDEFLAALTRPSVYFAYAGEIPLSCIALWQGVSPPEHLGYDAGRMILLPVLEEENVCLLFRASDGGVYKTSSALSPGPILDAIAEYSDNGFRFALEQEDIAVAGDMPLLPAGFSVSELVAAPVAFGEDAPRILGAFDMSPYTDNRYLESDGTVWVEGGRTFRLSTDGTINYSDRGTVEGEGFSVPIDKELPKESAVDGTYRVAEAALRPLIGDAALALVSVRDVPGGGYVIAYDCVLAGVCISPRDQGFVALFEVAADGRIRSCRMRVAAYSLSGGERKVMPLSQAAALADAPYPYLTLLFRPTGAEGEYEAVWSV